MVTVRTVLYPLKCIMIFSLEIDVSNKCKQKSMKYLVYEVYTWSLKRGGGQGHGGTK